MALCLLLHKIFSFLGSISRVKSDTFDACAAAFSAFSSVNHGNGDYSQTTLYGHPLNKDTSLPPTQTSLFRWKCARKGRREGDNGLCLPSVPFPWSPAAHHQSLAFRARLFQAKNEAPEEETGHLAITGSLLCPLEKKALTFSFNSSCFKIRTDNGHLFLAQSTDFRRKPTTV